MIIYGKNPVKEALKIKKVKKLIFRDEICLKFDENIPYEILPAAIFDKKFPKSAQSVAAEISFRYYDFDEVYDDLILEKNIAVLDQIQDPQNFGAIIRAGHCFGITYFIVAKNNQCPVTAAVFKASAGSLIYSRIVQVTNIARTLDRLLEVGFFISAADVDGKKTLSEIYTTERNCIILGSEEKGIRPNVLKRAHTTFKIEMDGKIDSLNVSQSSAIVFYHFFKGKQ
ncbi:RNA methyltransferase [Deferribacter autotrophicus]|uniref:RNA methyltransferase n=1 Tax=Deferribacter autotrophicus TaxID=500465 RepID=A0A5A8F627_9BACT|nr:RNA methyltransferase [Deferribacter autotrophicus]KAA0258863.1 RNA methyltransferase [Deferribacter autotrophicus]